MAQTKVWTANLGTTTRRRIDSGATAGMGQAKRWAVGRAGNFDYDAFVRFDLDWTSVGRIVSAVLTIYTDDGLGIILSSDTKTPHMWVHRLTSAFVEGNAPDGEWQSDDYTAPSNTASGRRSPDLTRAELGVNNIDITDIVEAWAPATVKKRDGSGGGKAANHGIGLYGTPDPEDSTGLVGYKFTDPTYRPILTLTYEYGPTKPDVPSSMAPSGSVAAFTEFAGNFTDIKEGDRLARSSVQVFDQGKSFTATASDNVCTSANHGLVTGDIVILTALTGGAPMNVFNGFDVERLSANTFWLRDQKTGLVVNITTDVTAGTWNKFLYGGTKKASFTEAETARFLHVPDALHMRPGRTYYWRASVYDQEGQQSPWSGLVSFSFQNTAPNAPNVSPDVKTYATMDGVKFNGNFSDPDAGDFMLAFEVQLSAYPQGDAHWDDAEFILWNTGKRYVQLPNGGTVIPGPGVVVPVRWSTPYGGGSLNAGTYYWRARVYDNKHSASAWTYATLTLTNNFEADPDTATTAIQLRPRAPWRILIKNMGAKRGPGTTVAVLEDAKNVGASEMYNSPGELHFTLPKAHPQISEVEPRQRHYAVEFRMGDGWHEIFAGLITDFDATDTDVVFYGIDYLGLLDFIADERYDPSNPDRPAEKGGSKYVTTGKNSINYIVTDQLTRAKNLANSPVGFITLGTIATMTETLTVYSTYAPTLQFVVGLLDSHRAGTGNRTRLRVRKTNSGGYEFVVTDDPGQTRDNMRMRYGELVQGYRVVAFGQDFATRVAGIGRAKDGIKVMYDQQVGQGIPEATWGRFTKVQLFDGVSDANDLKRRIRQAAMQAGKLGKQIGVGLRSRVLQPKDGYDICDRFPIDIEDGSVSTAAFGSGYWTVVGITWEVAAKDGKQTTTLTFQPVEDGVAPSADLLSMEPLSTQQEWQLAFAPPFSGVPGIIVPRRYHYDQSTGTTYRRTAGVTLVATITGTP